MHHGTAFKAASSLVSPEVVCESASFFHAVIFDISFEFVFLFEVFNLNVRKSMVKVYKSLHFSP